MYPVKLALHDFYHKSRALLGRETTIQTDRLAGRVPFDAGGPYDKTLMCTPMVLGWRTVYSRWNEIEYAGPGKWEVREMSVGHKFFAKPAILQTTFASSQDEAFSQAADWAEQRQKNRQCRETITRHADKMPGYSPRFRSLGQALNLAR